MAAPSRGKNDPKARCLGRHVIARSERNSRHDSQRRTLTVVAVPYSLTAVSIVRIVRSPRCNLRLRSWVRSRDFGCSPMPPVRLLIGAAVDSIPRVTTTIFFIIPDAN